MKTWALPLSMLSGALGYFAYISLPGHEVANPFVSQCIHILQPSLIFTMLFVTFCKIRLADIRLSRWHLLLLLFQSGSFALLTLPASLLPSGDSKVLVESTMLCLICPTATAAAVVTSRLGGNAASLVGYTILSNLTAAITIPLFVPFCHPQDGMTFGTSLLLILAKVFPLLICPLLTAELLRRLLPRVHQRIADCKDLAFKLWVVALSLAIAMTTHSLVHTTVSLACQFGIALVSLATCLLQFGLGRWVGTRYGDTISAGQGLGQKNTVFAIWLGYTFMTPVTAIAGGFYSIWHNLINSYQLNRKQKEG